MKNENGYGVETYTPPEGIVRVALERTKGITRRWGAGQRSTLGQLAVSAYLQGIEDAIKATHHEVR